MSHLTPPRKGRSSSALQLHHERPAYWSGASATRGGQCPATGEGDTKAIERTAHAYKSSAGTIVAHELAQLLNEMELAARAGDTMGAAGLMERVRAAHDAVLECLKR